MVMILNTDKQYFHVFDHQNTMEELQTFLFNLHEFWYIWITVEIRTTSFAIQICIIIHFHSKSEYSNETWTLRKVQFSCTWLAKVLSFSKIKTETEWICNFYCFSKIQYLFCTDYDLISFCFCSDFWITLFLSLTVISV